MIHKCADAVANWLINRGVIDREDFELYSYAMYSFLLSISPLLMAIFYGIFLGEVDTGIVLILPFMIIRKFSGGYHTKQSWTCLIGSSLLLCICIYIASGLKYSVYLGIVTGISAISLLVLSPIDSDNRRLDNTEKAKYKKATIYIVGVFLMVAIMLKMLKIDKYVACVCVGIILSAVLQIPCILKKIVEKQNRT